MYIGITSYKVHKSPELYDATLRCLESVVQNNPDKCILIDDSSDLTGKIDDFIRNHENVELVKINYNNYAKSLNLLCQKIFHDYDQSEAMILNNDIILDPYHVSVSDDWFISATEKCGHALFPFSAFITKRELYDTIGPFDEQFVFHFVDTDYAIRYKKYLVENNRNKDDIFPRYSEFKVHHESSMTCKSLTNDTEMMIDAAELFRKKWGFVALEQKYNDAYIKKYGSRGSSKKIDVGPNKWGKES